MGGEGEKLGEPCPPRFDICVYAKELPRAAARVCIYVRRFIHHLNKKKVPQFLSRPLKRKKESERKVGGIESLEG